MISKKVSSRRKELGISQADLARSVGVSRGSINKWERGDISIKGNNLLALSKALKCDVNWLLSDQGSHVPVSFDTSIETVPQKPQGAFPLISWVRAGDWSEISLTELHDADHYPCPIKCSKNTFLLKVVGTSMSPVFTEGELIFIDPEVEATNGKYVIARLEDENQATFKQLIVEDGHQYLQAANPDWPTPIQPINGNCSIVGVVITAMRLL